MGHLHGHHHRHHHDTGADCGGVGHFETREAAGPATQQQLQVLQYCTGMWSFRALDTFQVVLPPARCKVTSLACRDFEAANQNLPKPSHRKNVKALKAGWSQEHGFAHENTQAGHRHHGPRAHPPSREDRSGKAREKPSASEEPLEAAWPKQGA